MTLLLGAFLLFVIPGLIGLAFWAGPIRWMVRQLDARDVMSSLRPSRRRVAATDRRVDDLHIGLHYKVVGE